MTRASKRVIPFLRMSHDENKPDAARQSIGGDVTNDINSQDDEGENDSDEEVTVRRALVVETDKVLQRATLGRTQHVAVRLLGALALSTIVMMGIMVSRRGFLVSSRDGSTSQLEYSIATFPHDSCQLISWIPESSWENVLAAVRNESWCRQEVNCTCTNPVVPVIAPTHRRFDWYAGVYQHLDRLNQYFSSTNPPLDVVFLGDSLVEHLSGFSYIARPTPDAQEIFHNAFQPFFDKTIFGSAALQGMALGISGDTAPLLLERTMHHFDLDSRLQPALAWWIMIGANDYNQAHCDKRAVVAGIIANVEYILKNQTSSGPTVVINGLFPRGNDQTLFAENGQVSDINHALACYAAMKSFQQQHRSTPLVHFFNGTDLFLTRNDENIFALDYTLVPDYVHPNTRGSSLWMRAVVSTLLAWQSAE
jgi:lysophospholipase L1-like esterase